MDLEASFAEAQSSIKTRSDLSNEDKLQLYAHYKQATVGPATGTRPGRFDVVGRAKWDAWAALGSMTKDDAKIGYCTLVDGFVPGWRQAVEQPAQEQSAQQEPSRQKSLPPELASAPVQSRGHRQSGFRNFFKYLVGAAESLDEETSLMTPGEFVPVAHSITDKFLLLCALDSEVLPLYAGAMTDLPHLKARLVESLLTALRSAFCAGEGVPSEPLSLETHRVLSEHRLELLQRHLATAIKDHCSTHVGNTMSAEALSAKLLNAHGIPLTLLPKEELSEHDDQVKALKAKGGDSPSKVLGGIEFAPLNVPLRRRRQAFACMIGSTLILECFLLLVLCLYFWRITWPLLVPYLAWALVLDRSPWKGGMKMSHWLRNCALFKGWAEYHPATLIKANPNADFGGERPLLMGYHPHGILSFGAVLNVGTDCTGWSDKFPKLTPRLCTLNMNLKMPFLREIVGRLGCIPASEGSIKAALKPGNAVVLVTGGAAEALDTKPGQYVLTLARRKGFFRLALQQGADLVPSFGFGENDIYDTLEPRGLLRTLQQKAYKLMSFSMPMFYGRGLFTYNAGVLPYRRPLTVVVGEPMRLEKTPDPTSEQIEAVKEQYIAALRRLYEEWQPRLEPGRNTPLIIV